MCLSKHSLSCLTIKWLSLKIRVNIGSSDKIALFALTKLTFTSNDSSNEINISCKVYLRRLATTTSEQCINRYSYRRDFCGNFRTDNSSIAVEWVFCSLAIS